MGQWQYGPVYHCCFIDCLLMFMVELRWNRLYYCWYYRRHHSSIPLMMIYSVGLGKNTQSAAVSEESFVATNVAAHSILDPRAR